MRMFGGIECMTAEDFPPNDVKIVSENKTNMMKLITINDKGTANGMRDMSKTPLTDAEIEIVKSAIKKIEAHEYYGHRAYRDEYLAGAKKGDGSHTTPIWKDECRAKYYSS